MFINWIGLDLRAWIPCAGEYADSGTLKRTRPCLIEKNLRAIIDIYILVRRRTVNIAGLRATDSFADQTAEHTRSDERFNQVFLDFYSYTTVVARSIRQ